jgi:F420-dependent oxidoreductase-like protein
MAAGESRISFGITPIQTGVDFDHIRRVVVLSEQLGYDSVWLNDHFFTSKFFHPLPPPTAPYFECWVTLSALVSLTTRIRLGTLCSNVSFRQPALLAKMAACLDAVSGGRLELGLGAGWFEDEHVAYGFPFADMRERAERLMEAVEIIRRLWTEECVTFEGRYYRVENAYCSPKPVQHPLPKILIGGRGGRTMLGVVARSADRWNIQTPITPAQYRRKVSLLEAHCSKLNRNPGAIGRSLWAGTILGRDEADYANAAQQLDLPHTAYLDSRISGTPEQCIAKIKEFVDLGVTEFIHYFTYEELRSVELFAAKVIPAFR